MSFNSTSSSYLQENLIHSILTTISTNLTTLLTQTAFSISDIYDPRITRPFALICLFIGSIGNSISFIVFTQKQLRRHSTFRYLAYLSIVDLIVLYLGLGNIILRDYFLFDIREQNLFLCKFHTFLTYVTTHLSSWILTIVSIDRAIACTIVQLDKRFSRPKSADRIFLAMCITISLINSHILLFMGSKQQIIISSINNISLYKDIIICTHNTSEIYFQFFEKPYSIIDLFSYVLIPFVIMTICAGIIAYRLFFSLSNTTMNKRIKGKTSKGTRRAKQISYMLFILNLVFIILLAPIVIGQLFQDLNQEHHYRLFNSITLLLSYSNHALNFVLYGVASPQFRLTLKQLLGISNNYITRRRAQTVGFFTSTGV
ncbi:unnamed protein product [Rotaria sordida]|uniref:G-protein coupled receptors family 1 profile domain-containing protein n=1 Tax=Rotaria sordida TaxID=392033 RepID=A0A814N9H6_9BILA|nr:unnamed protein product [Rotaria sordida]CAF1088658.1 unnamed protein product [Rotaria sordida]CAF1304523.1 unnamed protein product [Rotaria sordida]CAF3814511.1 unnamed protein product [Rotaria sordida]